VPTSPAVFRAAVAGEGEERTANDAKDDPHVRCFDTFLRAAAYRT
jgi:hypothetical protein